MTDGQLLILADIVLILHLCIATYLTLGIPVVWLGRLAGWTFVYNPWFRYSHAGLMGFVLVESLIGVFCPLTVWEGILRRTAGGSNEGRDESFVAHWVGKLLFHNFDERVFTLAYAVFFALVTLTFFLVPPRKTRKKMPKTPADKQVTPRKTK